LHDGKRYRIHNNYLTGGGGYLSSTLRFEVQKAVGLDFQFHIRTQNFQLGILMSGQEFLGNNNLSGHLGYGLRKENSNFNFSLYGGLNYSYGVYAVPDTGNTTKPQFYNNVGVYVCGQAIKKLTYDIGIGLELYAEANQTQVMGGFKFILFFSDSYRGVKRNYNPNVKTKK
jgi:hypothetical protein